jgi:hypothetical protein
MLGKSSLLVLASQIFAVVIHSLAKFLATTGKVDPQQILQIRMFVTLSFNSFFLNARFPEELPLGNSKAIHLLAFRALGGVCGSFGFYCKTKNPPKPNPGASIVFFLLADKPRFPSVPLSR